MPGHFDTEAQQFAYYATTDVKRFTRSQLQHLRDTVWPAFIQELKKPHRDFSDYEIARAVFDVRTYGLVKYGFTFPPASGIQELPITGVLSPAIHNGLVKASEVIGRFVK